MYYTSGVPALAVLAHWHPTGFERSSILHGNCPSCEKVVQLSRFDTCPTEQKGASTSPNAVAKCALHILVMCICDVSWVVSTPRSPVLASLHLVALKLKPSWACPVWERRSVCCVHTHPPFCLNPGDATAMKGIGVWSAEVCWIHRHLDLFVGQQVLNLLPSPGIPTRWPFYCWHFSYPRSG